MGRFGPSSGVFSDSSGLVLLLWIICVVSVLFCCAFVRVCLLVLCGRLLGWLVSWLSFMVSDCDVVTFRLVSRVGCGALLYQFLILALFLTFISIEIVLLSDQVMVPERFYTGFTVVVSF